MNIQKTSFRLSSPLGIILVVGATNDIIDYVDTQIGNKQAIIAAPVRRDAKMAAVIHVDNDYEGDLAQATTQMVPTQLIEQIVGGLGKDWTGFHYLAALNSGIMNATGGDFFKGNKALTDYARTFFGVCFTKDGYVAGSRDQNEIMMIGPTGKRRNFAWKRDTEVKMIPSAFGKNTPIRNTTLGKDELVAVHFGTGHIVTMNTEEIDAFLTTDKTPAWKTVADLADAKIDDISTAYMTNDGNYTVLATGVFNGKSAIQQFNVFKDGMLLTWVRKDTIDLDDSVVNFGAIVRFDKYEVDLVCKDGNDLGTLTRFTLEGAPAPIKQAVQNAIAA